MESKDFSNLTITDVQFLPIVKEYARRINLVDTINHMVDTEMDLQPGPVVLGMVLDTLSGRSPLYRLMDFLEEKGVETRPIMVGNIDEQPVMRLFNSRKSGNLPNSRLITRNSFLFGNHHGIGHEEREAIAEYIEQFMQGLP